MLSICSISCWGSEVPLRGGSNDSILVSVEDIRIVNEKLIENTINIKKIHHYELQVESYETLVNVLNTRIDSMKVDIEEKDIQLKKEIKHKKLFIKTSVGATIVAILFMIV